MTRREFIKAALSSVGAVAFGPGLASGALPVTREYKATPPKLPHGWVVEALHIDIQTIDATYYLSANRECFPGAVTLVIDLAGPFAALTPNDLAPINEAIVFVLRIPGDHVMRLRGYIVGVNLGFKECGTATVRISVVATGPVTFTDDIPELPDPGLVDLIGTVPVMPPARG